MDYKNKSYYELLGVERAASTEEIKEAYKEIARVFHPDSQFYTEIVEYELSPEQEELFRAITNAYNTLIHPTKRTAYDKTLPKELAGWENGSRTLDDKLREYAEGRDRTRESSATWKKFGVIDEQEEVEPSLTSAHPGKSTSSQFSRMAFNQGGVETELGTEHSGVYTAFRNSYEKEEEAAPPRAPMSDLVLYTIIGGVAFVLGIGIVFVVFLSK
jgi:DnaJ-class molecular chaperone